MIFAQPKRFSPIAWVLILAILAFVALMMVNTEERPLRRAQRMIPYDPCGAAKLFAEAARSGERESPSGVDGLRDLNHPCALRELIELMDIPDEQLGYEVRLELYRSVQKKAEAYAHSGKLPFYDPKTLLPYRKRQKEEWKRWLESLHLDSAGGTTLPSSRSTGG